MLKDRKPHGNKHKLDENTQDESDKNIGPLVNHKNIRIQNKILEQKKKKSPQFESKPDVLTERMDGNKPDKDQQKNNKVFFNLKSFMLDKLMEHPVKKTNSKTNFKKVNQFKIKSKPQSKQKHLDTMPVFPNFPQKALKQKENTFMFKPTQTPRTPVREAYQKPNNNIVHPFIHNFLIGTTNEPETKPTDIKLEEFDFGFKLFPVDNFDSMKFNLKNSKQNSKHQQFAPPPSFPSDQLKLFPHKQQQKSETHTPFARPTFAPMFSVTPFVTSFGQQVGGGGGGDQLYGGGGAGGGGGQIRREYKATPLPSVRTTQKMNYEIFREYFPDIEIKKMSSVINT